MWNVTTPGKPAAPRPIQVFLCHSSGDKAAIRQLYDRLHQDGVNPWLDEKKLIPGQVWRTEIEKAVRASDAVVVCLSRTAVTKEGFVQREIRIALEVAEEKPEGTIFIIPARLDYCDVPARLQEWQWVNLFDEGGYKSLMGALSLRANSLGLSVGAKAPPEALADATDQLVVRALQHPNFVWRTAKTIATYAGMQEDQSAKVLERLLAEGLIEFRSHTGQGVAVALSARVYRMFRALPPAEFSQSALMTLGAAMTTEWDARSSRESSDRDPEENSGISAGYTYLGQFIYHDLTFDPRSSPGSHAEGADAAGAEGARFDLSCIYGLGPHHQPFLYRSDSSHMLLGASLTGNDKDPNARMLPRTMPDGADPSRAMIGDPRNDENVILSQLHAAFLRFHNRVVDYLGTKDFAKAQEVVRYHYQWVLLYDFLPTVIGLETLHDILPHLAKGTDVLRDPPLLKFYDADKGGIPVEFSAAAYRFGHSMIRPSYRLNQRVGHVPLFCPAGEDLRGFRALPSNWGIDWGLFFPMSRRAHDPGPRGVQPAYKIDTSLVNLLGSLPRAVTTAPESLAQRNLLRGLRIGLPSGQAVARAMGINPIPDQLLKVGPATEEDWPRNPPITAFSREFQGNAPLWFYILAEAQQQFKNDDSPIRLGPVGGRIIGEVIVGLIYRDSDSFLRQHPLFRPIPAFCANTAEFRIGDLLTESMQT